MVLACALCPAFSLPASTTWVKKDRRMTAAEIFARIDAVEVEDVKATAMSHIVDEDHALAAIGPISNLPDYDWIRRHSL